MVPVGGEGRGPAHHQLGGGVGVGPHVQRHGGGWGRERGLLCGAVVLVYMLL